MGHLAICDCPACAVEPQVGNVMLSAGIETAADLDMMITDRLIKGTQPVGKAGADLTRQSARGRDSEFAGVGAGARDHVEYGAGAGLTQSDAHEFAIQI